MRRNDEQPSCEHLEFSGVFSRDVIAHEPFNSIFPFSHLLLCEMPHVSNS